MRNPRARLTILPAVLLLLGGAGDALSATPAMPATAAVATPPVDARDVRFRLQVDEAAGLARAMAASGTVPAVGIAVVRNGEVLLRDAYGVVQAGSGQPASANTVFRLASLSKAFAATLAGLLEREGYLHWDDRVQDLVPSFQLSNEREAERLTVEQLLSHRVGLPRNSEDPMLERDQPYPLLAYRLREVPMSCGVGTCYGYQNVAYSLIGDVTFAVTGDFFSHQVESRLFHPLGMSSATYGRAALEASAEWARPHVRASRGWRAVPVRESYYRVPAAAGVNASITDLSHWLLAHLGHRPDVLSRDLLSNLHTPRVPTPGEGNTSPWRRERVRQTQYALGWRVYDYAGNDLVFHAGAVQGYRGMIGLLPGHDLGIALIWNCESSAPSGLMPMLLDAYLELPPRTWVAMADIGAGARVAKARPASARTAAKVASSRGGTVKSGAPAVASSKGVAAKGATSKAGASRKNAASKPASSKSGKPAAAAKPRAAGIDANARRRPRKD